MKYFILLLSLLFTFSCKRLKPQPKDATVFVPFLSSSSLYLRDNTNDFESKSLFESVDWYTYDFFGGHIAWSNLDIFAVNNGRSTFYFQIESFYDPTQSAGKSNPTNFANFTLNVQNNSGLSKVVFRAYACGAAQADPAGYAICQADPIRNRYTYLNLETLDVWKMSDSEAQRRTDWHIAFKDFDVMINNGINGPGRLLAGHAYRNGTFFELITDDVVPVLDNIKKANIALEGESYFDLIGTGIRYYLPKGTSRAIHEDDWYRENALGEKVAIDNTWIVKSIEGNSFFKLSIDEILNGEQIVFGFNYQSPQSLEFNPETFTYSLPPVTKGQIAEYCIDFDTSSLGCDNPNWDVRFESTADGKWYLWTNNGAIPLADKQVALGLTSAL